MKILINLIVPPLILTSFSLFAQVNFESSNFPIVVIDTQGRTIVDEPKITATMGIIDNGPGLLNSINDSFNNYDGFIGIEYRGSSSQFLFPKKSFGIETRDELGENLNVSVLGMPEENDWVLHGPYSDKAMIRNLLTFELGRSLGRYASRTRLVEIILNDEYWGVYLFMEKIKRDKNRVDISKLTEDEVSGDDLTGGYIIKIDKFDGTNSGDGWTSPYPPVGRQRNEQVIFFQFDYPKNRDIVDAQREYIKKYVTDFENALYGPDFRDPDLGYKQYVNLDSFVDFLIMMEVTRNVDAYRLSTFFYKDKNSNGGKITMGPIWDFNLAFGNANYCNGWLTNGWAWDFNSICPDDFWLNPFWWDRLMEDAAFSSRLTSRWTGLRSGPFKTETIISYIDSVASELDEAQQRNYERWDILGQPIWPNYFIGFTYSSEIEHLKNWVINRMEWLDTNLFLTTSISETGYEEIQPVIKPNPFTDHISFELPGNFSIHFFNTHGQEVFRTGQVDGYFVWNGQDAIGTSLPVGLYFYNLFTKNNRINGRIIKR